MEATMQGAPAGVVERAAAILAAVADYGRVGARLVDVARDTGIARPTVHRILQELSNSQLIEILPARRYGIGPAALALALSAPNPLLHNKTIQAVVEDLAQQTTVTAYAAALVNRRAYYVARGQGSAPVHVYSVEVGTTTPLPSTHAGIALMATVSPRVREQIMNGLSTGAIVVPEGLPIPPSTEKIGQALAQLEESGLYAVHELTIRGVSGMATLVPVGDGAAPMAVTLAAVGDLLVTRDLEKSATLLRAAASAIGREVRGLGDAH
ncbi:helix-turn-helix domain-containing protein [Gordonia sp. SID5947]|uniref:helix-turn-helix domain-containing protein n=1 Tax=Gordonia sp. SID5947 TaxID=2690315 RepID=UPI00136AF3A5|nr:helix-turn-helix domain-containing protein [Gordonia sp. SID5947]MYR07942.1 helix-turn-helix domain-containing protein [Gordonia sp. SID5947]